MPEVNILNEADLRQCVVLDGDAVDCVEACFRSLATEAVVMPPILRLDIEAHNGEVDVKTAYLPGVDSFAIKISPGFFDNPKRGLPSLNGMMVLLSSSTGLLEAVLLDNGYLTDMRTAAAGAVAAKWLAREDARRAAVIGAGVQAGMQLRALTLVRDIDSASVWARDAQKAADFAARMSAELGIAVRAAPSIAAAVAGSDIIVTATPAESPLLDATDLEPGQHVTAMGSDAEKKNELAPSLLARANQYVCDRLNQVRVLGELHHAIAAGQLQAEQGFPELGQIIAGQAEGRRHPADITVCDLTGTGAQDTAIATLARARAAAAGLGTRFAS